MTDEDYTELRDRLDEIERLKLAGHPAHRERYTSAIEFANWILQKDQI